MKKFVKFLLGLAAVAGTACGVIYFLKKVLGIDIFGSKDDFDDFDDDFDDDDDFFDEDNEEDREYVTLDLDEEADSETEDSDAEDSDETTEDEEAEDE